jgi:hypothetical protein
MEWNRSLLCHFMKGEGGGQDGFKEGEGETTESLEKPRKY